MSHKERKKRWRNCTVGQRLPLKKKTLKHYLKGELWQKQHGTECFWKKRQTTHPCVLRHSGPLSYATVSRARACTGSLRSSSAGAPHTSVSHSTAACHKSSYGRALTNHHETALPLPCMPTLTLSLCLFSLPAHIWISSVCIWERERERERKRETETERERRGRRINHEWRGSISLTHIHREKPSIMNRGSCLSCIPVSHFHCPNPGLDAVRSNLRLQSWLSTSS